MDLLKGYSSDSEENRPAKRERTRFVDDSNTSEEEEDEELVYEENQEVDRKSGEYISKRRKELLDSSSCKFPRVTVEDEYLDSLEIPEFLEKMKKKTLNENKFPTHEKCQFNEHTKLVNTIQWSNGQGHLLASASQDHTVKIFDVFRKDHSILTLEYGDGVRDVKWSKDNTKLLSCSLDSYTHLLDVETGSIIDSFKHRFGVTCVCFHPEDQNRFLVGGKSGGIVCWDIRSHKVLPNNQYQSKFGEVFDVIFLNNDLFISTAQPIQRNSLDKGIIVWDLDGVKSSNQVYCEGYRCTSLAIHPTLNKFIAESQGNYIAEFSSVPNYKLNDRKRYESKNHKVGLNRIRCSYSPDGAFVLSGSSDGNVYIYNTGNTKLIKTIFAHPGAVCNDVKYHPLLRSTIASCGGDGVIKIYE